MKAKINKIFQSFIKDKIDRIKFLQDKLDEQYKKKDVEDYVPLEICKQYYEEIYEDLFVLLALLYVESPKTFKKDYEALFS